MDVNGERRMMNVQDQVQISYLYCLHWKMRRNGVTGGLNTVR